LQEDNQATTDTANKDQVSAEKIAEKAEKKLAAGAVGASCVPATLTKKTLMFLIALNLFITGGMIYTYDKFFAQKIVSLDVKGYLKEQRDLFVARKIDEEQFRRNLDALEEVVKSTPRNKVIIMGDAVVGHAETVKP
jgi:hypothetical protein